MAFRCHLWFSKLYLFCDYASTLFGSSGILGASGILGTSGILGASKDKTKAGLNFCYQRRIQKNNRENYVRKTIIIISYNYIWVFVQRFYAVKPGKSRSSLPPRYSVRFRLWVCLFYSNFSPPIHVIFLLKSDYSIVLIFYCKFVRFHFYRSRLNDAIQCRSLRWFRWFWCEREYSYPQTA